jgi:hypothetical protein
MSTRSTFAKGALAAVAGVMALGAAASASAQSYGYDSGNSGYYDPCRRDSTGRGVVGALLGGGIGATVGSQLAARGHRTDGSVLGGVLGAVAGAAVGSNSAACTGGQVPYAPRRDNYSGYSQYGSGYGGYAPSYGRGYAPAPSYGYGDQAYGYGSRYEDDGYAYGRRGQRLRLSSQSVGADGCTLAESPIHMPDGRTQMRFVRVCMDSSGRYQVVD